MNNRNKSSRLEVPAVLAGSWKGEIAGKPHAHCGQQTQPGKPPRSVEFSYTMLPVTLTMPDNSFTWPGALFIMAPPRIEKRLERAGTLFSGSQLPALVLSLNVTRPQYSDLLRMIVTKRFGALDFTVEERVGNSWPIRSWGMATSLPSAGIAVAGFQRLPHPPSIEVRHDMPRTSGSPSLSGPSARPAAALTGRRP